jgi:hypothetical protein
MCGPVASSVMFSRRFLRLFGGLSIEEAGESLGLARTTAFRDWAYARAFLSAALGGEKNSQNS